MIVTLNLRSFNAQWIYSKLETSLQKSLVLLNHYPPIVNRFLLSFKDYDIKTEKEREIQFKKKWKRDILNFPYDFKYKNVIEWDAAIARKGILNPNGSKNYELTQLACHYIKGYAFQIDTLTNPRIKDFDEIVELASKKGWKLIFNLMAENTQKAKELIGDDLIYLMEENRKLLIHYYQSKGVVVVDNLYAVDNDQFIDQNWTTEHYAEKGRRIIAYNVAQKIKEICPNQYRDVTFDRSLRTTFLNDCEKEIEWSQMQTITNTNAFSGNYCSQTGNKNPYSITFEYPFSSIPDTSKNIINVKFMAYTSSKEVDAKIVIELHDNINGIFINSYPLMDQIKNLNEWQEMKCNIHYPDSMKNAELIKLYVYNPFNEEFLVDDFSIVFK